MKRLFLITTMLLVATATLFAQKEERAYVRKANRLYEDSSYVQSEVMYRKALDVNGKSPVAHYNLGNTLFRNGKYDEAAEEYKKAIDNETDKALLSKAYYNMGAALQKQQKYGECIDAYKNALRNDPANADAKYNLTKALMMMQQQQQQNQQDQQQKQQQQEQEQQQNKNNNSNDNNQSDKQEERNHENNQPASPQNQNEEMCKENAEQMLQAIMEDEKRVNEEVQQRINRATGHDLENNW